MQKTLIIYFVNDDLKLHFVQYKVAKQVITLNSQRIQPCCQILLSRPSFIWRGHLPPLQLQMGKVSASCCQKMSQACQKRGLTTCTWESAVKSVIILESGLLHCCYGSQNRHYVLWYLNFSSTHFCDWEEYNLQNNRFGYLVYTINLICDLCCFSNDIF